jgi:hypothetical protein
MFGSFSELLQHVGIKVIVPEVFVADMVLCE